MRGKRPSIGLRMTLATFALTLFISSRCAATEKKVGDGIWPIGVLIIDATGNLYGTTIAGGAGNVGSVFEMTPKAGGGWTEKVLYSFNDDADPPYAGVIFDAAGNLYGTTLYGGGGTCPVSCGTVFELIPKAGGAWTKKVLHAFNGKDGSEPYAGVTIDGSGNLYGTTLMGGNTTNCGYGCGTVFELIPKAGGAWTKKVLHAFNYKDGAIPYGVLVLDRSGNLYGTTSLGGAYGAGTVFELTPNADGGWKENVLHSFNHDGKDGIDPQAGLIFDRSGILYGTTFGGGTYGDGTVFELMLKAGGGWTEKVLHSFNGKDGLQPYGGVIIDGSGNLYGTTTFGGTHGYNGNVFELTLAADGSWKEKVLHNFPQNVKDGYQPHAGVIIDGSGNLYGTTYAGGAQTWGTVFEVTPEAGGGWTEKVLHSFNPYSLGSKSGFEVVNFWFLGRGLNTESESDLRSVR
jgi:uncharacterized repeat protein (TIGR03803 family)